MKVKTVSLYDVWIRRNLGLKLQKDDKGEKNLEAQSVTSYHCVSVTLNIMYYELITQKNGYHYHNILIIWFCKKLIVIPVKESIVYW